VFSWWLQIVAIAVGVVSVGAGIGIPIFYENQIDNSVSALLLLLNPVCIGSFRVNRQSLKN
jgi:Tfp pilus assembly major pilin PilA